MEWGEVAPYTLPVLPDLQYAAIRFENFVSEILLPAAFPDRSPLAVTVFIAGLDFLWRP
jgi:hypothetical protein